MKTVKAVDLIEDYDLYPRGSVDATNVTRLVEALETGKELPPILVEAKTLRIVDGFHRKRAAIRHGGEEAVVQIIERKYRSDAELFEEACKYNSSHGVKLNSYDRVRCLQIAERIGLSLNRVAGAMGLSVERCGSLRVDRTATSAAGLSLPIKRTIRHMRGRPLTERQQEANTKLSGMNQVFYVNQVIELIESELLNTDDQTLMGRIGVLQALLNGLGSAMAQEKRSRKTSKTRSKKRRPVAA